MGLNPFSDYDPFDKLEYLESYTNQQAEVIQELARQNAHQMWLINQLIANQNNLTALLKETRRNQIRISTRLENIERELE